MEGGRTWLLEGGGWPARLGLGVGGWAHPEDREGLGSLEGRPRVTQRFSGKPSCSRAVSLFWANTSFDVVGSMNVVGESLLDVGFLEAPVLLVRLI